MVSFDFITNENFRASLEADYRELTSCIKGKAWKSVLVLAGSIIEAVLIDYLMTSDYTKKSSVDPLKMDLGQAITICKDEGILSKKTVDLSSAIKHYRNLIHPGRAVRLNEIADENGANIAFALLGIILEEVSKRKKETYGYTAEQIVTKLELDSSAIAILGHLLKSANQAEIERLLLKVIPQRYFEILESGEEISAFDNNLPNLKYCFRSAFEIASEDLKRRVTTKFVTILKEETEYKVLTYETQFFSAKDLKYLSSDDTVLVKHHLLSRIEKGLSASLLKAIEGLFKFLTVDEITNVIDAIVKTIIWDVPEKLKKSAKDYIINEWYEMEEKVQNKAYSRLDDWMKHFEKSDQNEFVNIILELKTTFELPF